MTSLSILAFTSHLINGSGGELQSIRKIYSKFKLGGVRMQLKTSQRRTLFRTFHYPTTTHETKRLPPHKFLALAVRDEANSKSNNSEETTIPSWAKPDSEEPPPWAKGKEDSSSSSSSSSSSFEIPFYAYLLASTITAIAAIGSIFEYINQKPVFGLLDSDSIFYAPVLGFFAITGVPTSAFLWYKSVQAANKAAEEQDQRDGSTV